MFNKLEVFTAAAFFLFLLSLKDILIKKTQNKTTKLTPTNQQITLVIFCTWSEMKKSFLQALSTFFLHIEPTFL